MDIKDSTNTKADKKKVLFLIAMNGTLVWWLKNSILNTYCWMEIMNSWLDGVGDDSCRIDRAYHRANESNDQCDGKTFYHARAQGVKNNGHNKSGDIGI